MLTKCWSRIVASKPVNESLGIEDRREEARLAQGDI
jgi:hypothetical protein